MNDIYFLYKSPRKSNRWKILQSCYKCYFLTICITIITGLLHCIKVTSGKSIKDVGFVTFSI